jgi:6-phosphofructokinase
MAETSIPVDAVYYLDPENHPLPKTFSHEEKIKAQHLIDGLRREDALTPKEKSAIVNYHGMRKRGRRLEGQTSDDLRRAGLKIVLYGLKVLLRSDGVHGQVQWDKLRVVANEPRHLVRSINPSTSDIVMGQRLGTLAVDNAMAGCTDFMISQWLTGFVLVPLKLVVLGRKRVPQSGVFWRSVLAKTRQEGDLVKPWPNRWG